MPSLKLKRPFLIFGQPDITDQEARAVVDVLSSGWIGTGKVTKQFEEAFVKHQGGGHAVAVSSCSIGLVIALKALGICRGSNVLTTPITFCATVNAILQLGARPVFSEVDLNGNLDQSNIQKSLLHGNVWRQIDCVLPVNYTGFPANIKPQDIPIVEDAAHSFGGSCGYGDITVFSFYATKNITSGEGGMIWTKNKDLADRCRMLSNQGQSSGAWGRYNSGPIENYQILDSGFKANMPDLIAAIGLTQLNRWPEMKKKREAVWRVYEEAFGSKGVGHSKHLYTIEVKNRAKVREFLYNKGIGTGIHYEALHLQPAYDYLGYKKGDFPIAERIGERTLSLPVSNKMTREDADYVVLSVKQALKEFK